MTKQGVGGKTRRAILKRVLLISTIVLCVYCALSLIGSYILCGFIFARYEDSDPLAPDYAALVDPPPRTRVTFASGKNTLTGYLYEPEAPVGIILIAHGMRAGNDSHLPEALYFLENDWAVFTFDGTGAGESTGEDTVGLEQMVRDVRAAMSCLSEHPATAELPLMLYGHSMGGYAVSVAAEDSESLAVVSIAGFDSPMEIMLNKGRRYAGGVAVLGYPFLCLQNKLTFGADADRHAVDAINRTDRPFLIVYGTADEIISPEESIWGNRDAIRNPAVSYVLIDESGRDSHTAAWYSAEAMAYRATLAEELADLTERYDGRIPAEALAAFESDVDYERLHEPDTAFMDTVLQFYTDALTAAEVSG